MTAGSFASDETVADRPSELALSKPDLLAAGYCRYERFMVRASDGGHPAVLVRDILRCDPVAAVLPIDPARDRVVLLRQVRPAAQLVDGRGDLVEIVAGRVEPKETPISAARRECVEEIGVEPSALVELFSYLPSPGITDEQITLFVGVVDSSGIVASGGAPSESEVTRPLSVPVEVALAANARNAVRSGPLVVALQWLAFNRDRLPDILRTGLV
jgi:ADP-ribose pyrophosphatase